MKSLIHLYHDKQLIDWMLHASFIKAETLSPDSLDFKLYWHQAGIISLQPNYETTSDIILSCGVHGNETAPIELCEQLFSAICEHKIKLNCRLMIIFGNLDAIRQNKRFCDENLNRLFSQNHHNKVTREASRAAIIEKQVEAFFSRDTETRIHLDLHTAIRASKYPRFAIYPYRPKSDWQDTAINWLAQSKIQALLLANKFSGTFSCYTSHQFDAIAFTIELGKALPFGANDLEQLKQFKSGLEQLLGEGYFTQNREPQDNIVTFKVVDEVIKHHDKDFQLCLSDETANFSTLTKGTHLTLDGAHSYRVKSDHQAVVFPNPKVPVGQRVALVVEPIE